VKKIKYVYVAGPYSRPVPNHNVKRAIEAADKLLAAGFVPYLPHLTHLWDTVSPHDYEEWLALDLAWIERCDALLRLPGESSGADREVGHAKALGLPVFGQLEGLLHERREGRV